MLVFVNNHLQHGKVHILDIQLYGYHSSGFRDRLAARILLIVEVVAGTRRELVYNSPVFSFFSLSRGQTPHLSCSHVAWWLAVCATR